MERIPLTEDTVRTYLDTAIHRWQTRRGMPEDVLLPGQTPAGIYIDVLQSVRQALLGEPLGHAAAAEPAVKAAEKVDTAPRPGAATRPVDSVGMPTASGPAKPVKGV